MPPIPGKIHNLPVRVSYTIDNSPQSYFTLLSDRQKVYVHPKTSGINRDTQAGPSSTAPATGSRAATRPSRKRGNDASSLPTEPEAREAGSILGIGSCVLKGVVWGVCYASPECVPSPSIHDFSVYALDPTPTSRTDPEVQERWDGKGFLSWALYEPNEGTTLVRGKIIYDPEAFESVSFDSEGGGGLEGLMALAASDSATGESEGEGWGLEVMLSLKMVELGGKGVGDKKEFGEMIASAQSGTAGRMSVLAQQARPAKPTVVDGEKRGGVGPRRIEPRLVPPESGGKGSSTFGNTGPHLPLVRSLAGPGPARAVLSTATSLPDRPKSSSSSIPPSSIPMAQTSSNESQKVDQSMMPPPPDHPRTSSGPLPRSSSTTPTPTALATTVLANITPPSSTRPTESDDRETTPPPTTHRSPPPSTPARLQAILRSDAKLSPGLARSLANNPTLLRLLKNVPASSIPLSALSGLKSPFGGTSPGKNGKIDPNNINPNPFGPPPPPPAFNGSSPNKPSPATSSSYKFNNNNNTPDATAGPSRVLTKSTSGQVTGVIVRECYNCHTNQSSMWRSKKSKTGEVLSVCDECGLYFNKHKTMRPVPSLSVEGKGDKKGKGKAKTPTNPNKSVPPHPTTSTSASNNAGTKRQTLPQQPPPPPPLSQQGVRSSPRRATRTQPLQNPPVSPSRNTPQQPESPARKRKKPLNPPLPSPRRNTRAAAKELHTDVSGPSGSGSGQTVDMDGRAAGEAVPISSFGPNENSGEGIGGDGGEQGEDEIEAFLKQFETDAEDQPNDQQDGNGENVNLDQWFKEVGIDMGVVDDHHSS